MLSKTNKGGRPTKLTPKLQKEIMTVIRSGNYIETACAYVGINKDTYYEWMKRGAREIDRVENNPKARVRKDEKKYVDFSKEMTKALAHAEIRDVAIIAKAGETNWQASAWRLERKFPQKWGRKENYSIEHSGKDGNPIETNHTEEINLSNLTDEELDKLENIIEKSTDKESNSD